MDYVSLLQSVNKVAIIAFFIILVFIGVEVSWIMKGKKKNEKIEIPDFSNRFGQKVKVATIKQDIPQKNTTRSTPRKFIILTLLCALIGLVTLFILYINPLEQLTNKKPSKVIQPVITPIIEVVESEGIYLYTKNWKKLQDKTVTLDSLDSIFIGVHTIDGVPIDRARIRVNKNTWNISDETVLFDSTYGVYYKEYSIATNESQLKIDAQLHSKEDGWLSE